MTQDEIKHGLLQVCKVEGWDGDFNIVGFHVLCDKLKQLGAEEEREACKKLAKEHAAEYKVGGRLYTMLGMNTSKPAEAACDHIAHLISKRGQA
jgi:hypothetical protein